MRKPFMSAPGRHDGEAAGTSPVDQITDESGLVTEGQRVNHASIACFSCQQRPAKCVRFYSDIDHMFAMRKSLQAVIYSRDRISCAFDDDINPRILYDCVPVFRDPGCAVRNGFVHTACIRTSWLPAHPLQIAPCIVWKKISYGSQMHTWCAGHLCQIHGAKF